LIEDSFCFRKKQ